MFESIHRVLSALHWAHTNDARMLMMLQDMRKAFDLLDRGYLRAVLLLLAGHRPRGTTSFLEPPKTTPVHSIDLLVLKFIDLLVGIPSRAVIARSSLDARRDAYPTV